MEESTKNEKDAQKADTSYMYMIADAMRGNNHGTYKNCFLDKKYHVETLDFD